jgi:hypothetical protein
MSSKYYAIISIRKGHERLDVTQRHDPASAKDFLRMIGHSRHAYAGEIAPSRWTDSDLVIFANDSGVLAQGFGLALDMAVGSSKSDRAARENVRVLALAYNDQCLIDAFSYYEHGVLVRRVIEMDGDERSDVVMEGDLLPEEIDAIVRSAAEADLESDRRSEFMVDGKTYAIEGFVPLRGCSLEIAKRLGVDLDSMPAESSLYAAKPWWKRW